MKTGTKLKLLFSKAAGQIADFELPDLPPGDPARIDSCIAAAKAHAGSLKGIRQSMEELIGLCRDKDTQETYRCLVIQIMNEEALWEDFAKEMKICRDITDISRKQDKAMKILEDIRSIKTGRARDTGKGQAGT